MDFSSVHSALLEVFPQVDVRILKAVAIEHSKDVAAAVEYVLLEVLPGMRSEVDRDLSGIQDWPFLDAADNSNLSSKNLEVSNGNTCLSSALRSQGGTESCSRPSTTYGLDAEYTDSENPVVLDLLVEVAGNKTLSYSSVDGEDADSQEICGLEYDISKNDCCPSPNPRFGEEKSGYAAPQACQNLELLDETMSRSTLGGCEHIANNERLDDVQGPDVPFSRVNLHDITSGSKLVEDENMPASICQLSSFVEEQEVTPTESCATAEKNVSASMHERGGQCCEVYMGTDNVAAFSQGDLSQYGNDVRPTLTGIQSVQMASIDLLEDCIETAKNYKKILSSEMGSLRSKICEVELEEKAAYKAKDEVLRSTTDIQSKVAELKRVIHRAKEANDLHASEIYGEKSVLATEARELQTRLRSLSDQKDKSLAMITKMHKNLHARLATAQAEKVAAEHEKLHNGELALQDLVEQERLMESVVEGSKMLQLEADKNAKLREFLVDRGRLVDSLQGEIAVVCEDIELLSQKVYEWSPIGRVLSASWMTDTLDASITSLEAPGMLSATASLEAAAVLSLSSGSLATASQELSNSRNSAESSNCTKDGENIVMQMTHSENEQDFLGQEWQVVLH